MLPRNSLAACGTMCGARINIRSDSLLECTCAEKSRSPGMCTRCSAMRARAAQIRSRPSREILVLLALSGRR